MMDLMDLGSSKLYPENLISALTGELSIRKFDVATWTKVPTVVELHSHWMMDTSTWQRDLGLFTDAKFDVRLTPVACRRKSITKQLYKPDRNVDVLARVRALV